MLEKASATVTSAGAARRWLARRINEVRRLDGLIAEGEDGDGGMRRDRGTLVEAMLTTHGGCPRSVSKTLANLPSGARNAAATALSTLNAAK